MNGSARGFVFFAVTCCLTFTGLPTFFFAFGFAFSAFAFGFALAFGTACVAGVAVAAGGVAVGDAGAAAGVAVTRGMVTTGVVTTGGGAAGGVTQFPLASLIIPAGTVAWLPAMFGHSSTGGGVHDAVPPFRALIRRPWAL